MTAATISAWLLTYLLHSTLILIAALVLSRLMGGRYLTVQEGMFRTALIGGILTASVQLGFGISPAAGNFALNSVTAPVPGVMADFPLTNGEAVAQTSTVNPVRASGLDWTTALIVLWFVTSISALVVVLRSVLDLKRLLRTRCFQPAGHMVEKLAAAMGLRRQVKVSTSRAISVPFATGITQPEICCPERVNELAREHRRGLYAHELAHLARHDPAWQLLYRLGEAVFSLQPLNRLVRRRLEEIAEHLTDERAVAGTGDRLGLARCLVVVAHWKSAAPIGLPATTFAAGPRLDRRIRRLLSGAGSRQVSGTWAIPIGAALLVGAVAILPMVGTNTAHAELSAATATKLAPSQSDGELTSTETTRTWSTSEDRPTDAPPPAAEPPAPPTPVSPAPEVAPAPEALSAPPSPPSAPTTGTLAPPARPGTAAPPVPSAEPAPAAAPEQPAPAAAPQPPETERTSEEQEARERTRQSAKQRVRVQEEQRSRAEAMVREQRVIAREQAESARRIAEEAARQSRVSEAEHREMRIQIRERQAVAHREARKLSLAERDRVRALAEEARAAAREAIVDAQRLTDEQREELLLQATELREQAELRNREIAEAAKARARALAQEARRLAEQAEAERLEREKQDR